jgi:hypothetical protein
MSNPEVRAIIKFNLVLMHYYINTLAKTAQAGQGKMLDACGATA